MASRKKIYSRKDNNKDHLQINVSGLYILFTTSL